MRDDAASKASGIFDYSRLTIGMPQRIAPVGLVLPDRVIITTR